MPGAEQGVNGRAETVAARANDAGVFRNVVVVDNDKVVAKAPLADAEYRVEFGQGGAAVSLSTQDRWLSGSIEGDLMNTGDDMGEMLEEELDELGVQGVEVSVQHFRDDAKRYTFRTETQSDDPRFVGAMLLAYQAVFGELGDMAGGEDDG